jgi:BirA family biotin operon repressor/biotin-[acetyl-CoA-carboxylase] ligase
MDAMEGKAMLGTPLYHYDEVDSTMDQVAALGRAGAPEGATVIAARQRQGRGRQGRAWLSPAAENLYMSVLLRPQIPAAEAPPLALAFGLGVAAALEEFAALPAALKWPNDVLVRGRKIAGLLLESVLQGQELRYIVVGIGVNVNGDSFPAPLADTATSVRLECGTAMLLEAFVPVCLRHLDAVYQRFLAHGFMALAEAWNARDALRGRRLRLHAGTRVLEGLAQGVSPGGALVLETPEGRQQILSGEVLAIE